MRQQAVTERVGASRYARRGGDGRKYVIIEWYANGTLARLRDTYTGYEFEATYAALESDYVEVDA